MIRVNSLLPSPLVGEGLGERGVHESNPFAIDADFKSAIYNPFDLFNILLILYWSELECLEWDATVSCYASMGELKGLRRRPRGDRIPVGR